MAEGFSFNNWKKQQKFSLLDQDTQDEISSWGSSPEADATKSVSKVADAGKTNMMAQGIADAGAMTGKSLDPEGSGTGPVIAGAAQGAATGTMIAPGYGTAIGAVIGLGLGMLQAKNKRKEIRRIADAKAGDIRAQGMANAAEQMGKIKFRFGGG